MIRKIKVVQNPKLFQVKVEYNHLEQIAGLCDEAAVFFCDEKTFFYQHYIYFFTNAIISFFAASFSSLGGENKISGWIFSALQSFIISTKQFQLLR